MDVRNSLSPGLDIGTSLGCRDLTLDGSVWGAGSKADEYNTTSGIDICAVNVMQWTVLFLVDASSKQEGLEEGVKFARLSNGSTSGHPTESKLNHQGQGNRQHNMGAFTTFSETPGSHDFSIACESCVLSLTHNLHVTRLSFVQ